MKRASSTAPEQIAFDWIEPDARTLAGLAGECVDIVRSAPPDRTIVLISCSKSKGRAQAPAAELYISPRFKLSQQFASRQKLNYFIISAKHGLLSPGAVVEPYDVNLASLSADDRIAWARDVLSRLLSLRPDVEQVIILADDLYSTSLVGELTEKNIPVAQPLSGFSKETSLALLRHCIRLLDRTDAVQKFYETVEQWRVRSPIVPLREALQHSIPEQGVYFFFDPNEETRFSSVLGRLVRIGTHGVSIGSKASLRDRLRAHLGTMDGYGNHRSSVFRLHVGEAMIRRDGLRKRFPQWGAGQNSSSLVRERERPLERKVSEAISRLHVATLDVADTPMKTSARAVIETSMIALFTENCQPVENSRSDWLGRYSAHDLISRIGLWNLRDVGSEADLKIVETLRGRLF